jgi:hypothetical protein
MIRQLADATGPNQGTGSWQHQTSKPKFPTSLIPYICTSTKKGYGETN